MHGIILVVNNGLGFNGLVSVLGLDAYVHNKKLKLDLEKI